LAIAALITVAAAGVANAQNTEEIRKTAAAGGVLILAHYASVNPDCTSKGKVVVRLVNAPAHGSIALKQGSDFTTFSGAKQCNVRKVEGVTAVYRPDRGFVGPDVLGVDIIYPSGRERFQNYTITVK
jgi:hypothetical protein